MTKPFKRRRANPSPANLLLPDKRYPLDQPLGGSHADSYEKAKAKRERRAQRNIRNDERTKNHDHHPTGLKQSGRGSQSRRRL